MATIYYLITLWPLSLIKMKCRHREQLGCTTLLGFFIFHLSVPVTLAPVQDGNEPKRQIVFPQLFFLLLLYLFIYFLRKQRRCCAFSAKHGLHALTWYGLQGVLHGSLFPPQARQDSGEPSPSVLSCRQHSSPWHWGTDGEIVACIMLRCGVSFSPSRLLCYHHSKKMVSTWNKVWCSISVKMN